MYRGYKTYRAYLNAKLHALSVVICGDMTVLKSELDIKRVKSVTELSDSEAKDIYLRLIPLAKNTNKLITQATLLANGTSKMTTGQRKKLIRLTRYKFGWKPENSFNYILKTVPDSASRLSDYELKNKKLVGLFGILTKREADKVLKRLEKIELKNFNKEVQNA